MEMGRNAIIKTTACSVVFLANIKLQQYKKTKDDECTCNFRVTCIIPFRSLASFNIAVSNLFWICCCFT